MNQEEKIALYFEERHLKVSNTIDEVIIDETPLTTKFNAVERNQNDGLQAEYTVMGGLMTGPGPLVRDEFRDDTDINSILRRHGVGLFNNQIGPTPIFTDNDDTIDLQTALEMERRAKQAFNSLPKHVREKYPTLADLLHAADAGTLDMKEPEPPPPLPAAPPTEAPNGNGTPA